MRRVAAILATSLLAIAPAAGEELLLNLSSDHVVIASNFTGTEIVLFGAIVPDRNTASRVGRYDIAVTVRGPSRDLVVRRKQRVLGIWLNREAQTFPLAPSYLALLTSQPAGAIASPDLQDRYGLTLDSTFPGVRPAGGGLAQREPFLDALIRHKRDAGLYLDSPTGVTFIADNLFRARIPLPPNVPIGEFQLEVKLFANQVLLEEAVTSLRVAKSGFEAQVASLAENWPWTYGIGAAGLAFFFGWAATVIFRRD